MNPVCPFLVVDDILTCRMGDDFYMPTVFELNEFCQSGKYGLCGFYFVNNQGRAADCRAYLGGTEKPR